MQNKKINKNGNKKRISSIFSPLKKEIVLDIFLANKKKSNDSMSIPQLGVHDWNVFV